MKAATENKLITYKRILIKLIADIKNIGCHRLRDNIFKVLKEGEKTCQIRILYPAKLSSQNEGEIMTFQDKQKLTEFISRRLILKKYQMKSLRLKVTLDSSINSDVKNKETLVKVII